VVETTAYEDQPTVAREVGAGAAEYLMRILQSHDKIVISWGGSLLGMVNALFSDPPPKDVEDVMVIQGLGGLGDPNSEVHGSDLTRRLAKALGAQAFLLPAPGVAGSRSAYDALYTDPHVAEALRRAREANLAFMGIGAPRPDSILVREGTIVSWPELAKLREQGAVGDINLRYFDERGQTIASDLDSRVIGLTLDEIRQIGHIVGVAGGSAKFNAIRAALVGKLVDVLVTDHLTAQRLLDVKGETSIAKRGSRKGGRAS
jgi:DNA-binding transcriptional regulator LsrR (DeoR family)